MPNLMQRGAAWLGEKLNTVAGREIEYSQNGETAIEITAPMAMQAYEVRKGDGSFDSVVFCDWTITATDLGDLEPVSGDLITETVGGQTITYEVMPIDKRPCAEWLDTSGILLTVHSKRIDVDA